MQSFTVINPRCGTTFLLVVVVLSILLFVLLGAPTRTLRLLSRIVLVPIVAAFAYEAIRWGANHYGNRLVRLILAPGLALQRLTTRPPDDSMVEVGIAALQRVLVLDGVLAAEAVAANRGVAPGREQSRGDLTSWPPSRGRKEETVCPLRRGAVGGPLPLSAAGGGLGVGSGR